MSQRALSGNQFDPSTIGPEQASSEIEKRHPMHAEYHTGPAQRRLFSLSEAPMAEPHQQFRHQFANDPRTWWHGRYSEALPRTGGQKNAGVHVGTFGSSDERRRKLGPSRKTTKTGTQEWRSFPVRLQGPTSNLPWEPARDEGARWREHSGVHYYRNDFEHRGSISAKAPSRSQILTHPQAIKEAKAAGKHVDPMIEWESKQIGKEYDPSRRDPQAVIAEMPKPWENRNLQQHLFNPQDVQDSRAGFKRRYDLETEAQKSIAQQRMEKSPAFTMTPDEHLEYLKAKIPGLKEHLEAKGK